VIAFGRLVGIPVADVGSSPVANGLVEVWKMLEVGSQESVPVIVAVAVILVTSLLGLVAAVGMTVVWLKVSAVVSVGSVTKADEGVAVVSV
jgi:hypothetical protein